MAYLNGLGPNNQGPLTGRGLGNCAKGTNTAGRIGMGLGGLGVGLGMAWRLGRGLRGRGFGMNNGGRLGGRFQPFYQPQQMDKTDEKAELDQYKENLKRELEAIDNRLNEIEE
jgi:hypothetical protein